jgi:hypothetical protein
MTIFGFNTDVKYGNTSYHIQSEPRLNERLLETQVFVGGRCIGKRAAPYDDVFFQPGSIDTQLQQVLREQHRTVVEAAREGRLARVLDGGSPGNELSVHWVNADSVFVDDAVVMRFHVTQGGQGVKGASLTSRVRLLEAPPIYSQTVTDDNGNAEMRITVHDADLRDAEVMVEAMHFGRSAVRKFRLRKLP